MATVAAVGMVDTEAAAMAAMGAVATVAAMVVGQLAYRPAMGEYKPACMLREHSASCNNRSRA